MSDEFSFIDLCIINLDDIRLNSCPILFFISYKIVLRDSHRLNLENIHIFQEKHSTLKPLSISKGNVVYIYFFVWRFKICVYISQKT